jgi:hypothetical protein
MCESIDNSALGTDGADGPGASEVMESALETGDHEYSGNSCVYTISHETYEALQELIALCETEWGGAVMCFTEDCRMPPCRYQSLRARVQL